MKQKRAIITGGGTGIGESIAQRFKEERAKVLITGRREDKLMEAAKGNPNIRILSADLTAPEGPKEIVDAA
ncbi:MAG: SDR family NAD(P)-dependent oxidoreductase, partial [Candidatus Omnitrophica bacterium]|nr:SDR family NAD(P)-dependent oxidoreductase [Candidatus Omnitrophota bacterium]